MKVKIAQLNCGDWITSPDPPHAYKFREKSKQDLINKILIFLPIKQVDIIEVDKTAIES